MIDDPSSAISLKDILLASGTPIGIIVTWLLTRRQNNSNIRKTDAEVFIESQDKILELVEKLRIVYADVIKLEQAQSRNVAFRQRVKAFCIFAIAALKDVAVDERVIKELNALQEELDVELK